MSQTAQIDWSKYAAPPPSPGAPAGPTIDWSKYANQKASPPTSEEPKGFWHGVGSEIGSQLSGLADSITAPWHAAEAAYSQLRDAGMSPVKAIAAAGLIGFDKMPGVGPDVQGSVQQIQDWQRRKAEGYGVPYSVVAGVGQTLGINPTAMEAAAKRGDTAGIYGHALTDVGETLAGAGVSELTKARLATASARSCVPARCQPRSRRWSTASWCAESQAEARFRSTRRPTCPRWASFSPRWRTRRRRCFSTRTTSG